jgi:hypothetical protein
VRRCRAFSAAGVHTVRWQINLSSPSRRVSNFCAILLTRRRKKSEIQNKVFNSRSVGIYHQEKYCSLYPRGCLQNLKPSLARPPLSLSLTLSLSTFPLCCVGRISGAATAAALRPLTIAHIKIILFWVVIQHTLCVRKDVSPKLLCKKSKGIP